MIASRAGRANVREVRQAEADRVAGQQPDAPSQQRDQQVAHPGEAAVPHPTAGDGDVGRGPDDLRLAE